MLVTALAAPAVAQGADEQPAGRHLALELVPESATPAAGSRVTLALSGTLAKGWHAYWKNGGDAGIETRLDWTLPASVTAGELRYPVPQRLLIAGLMNYVYEAPFALFVDLAVPAGLAPGTRLPVRIKADYLVCTEEICVPEQAELATELTVGDGAVEPATRARFDRWRAAFPRPLGTAGTFEVASGRFRLAVPFPAAAEVPDGGYFYPLTGGAVDYAAPQRVVRDGDRLVIETKAATAAAVPPMVEGVLSLAPGRGFLVRAAPGSVAAATRDVMSAEGTGAGSVALVLLGAVLGGLLLNVMPCVFPILSLKALSLARGGGAGEREAKAEALAYTAGVVLVCAALGAALLAVRAGGSAAGWAFQLQDPRVIAGLLVLVTAIALNLAGLFEVPTPTWAGEAGGMGGAFATGALAAFVATPCSGPFMGAALGAALVLPAAAAMAVFAGLGVGIALPFLALGFIPALRRRLPRPGPWLGTARRVLSVPMFLTALALSWVLARQAGANGIVLGLAAAMALGLGLWWAGRRQERGLDRAWWPVVPAALLTVAALLPVQPEARAAEVSGMPGAEPFTEARLTALQNEGRPVFAYFTADWCLTCKVNEKAAIETSDVADAFRRAGVAVLVGDWTDGDPAMGRFIERHNRAGVPLYLWYSRGRDGRVLPQLLTPSMLIRLPQEKTG